MTHRDYFKEHGVSIEQYGVLLVSLAFGGTNTPHGNKGFDVDKAIINGKPDCRIEVKSKVTHGVGKASVIHCNENKFTPSGMTHLAVVLVDPDSYAVADAWLITTEQAKTLRRPNIKTRYISVNDLRNFTQKTDITSILKAIAMKYIKDFKKK